MWRTNIIKWDKISTETSSLYLDLAEKRLDETVETSKNISEKNDKLLTLCVTLITADLTYLVNTVFSNAVDKYFQTALIIMLCVLLTQIWFLFKNIKQFKIGTKGEEPRFILLKKYIKGFNNDEQIINLSLQICETYQEKINSNHLINAERNKNLTIAIYLFLGLPISFLLALGYYLFVYLQNALTL